jgi:hypothetical protein
VLDNKLARIPGVTTHPPVSPASRGTLLGPRLTTQRLVPTCHSYTRRYTLVYWHSALWPSPRNTRRRQTPTRLTGTSPSTTSTRPAALTSARQANASKRKQPRPTVATDLPSHEKHRLCHPRSLSLCTLNTSYHRSPQSTNTTTSTTTTTRTHPPPPQWSSKIPTSGAASPRPCTKTTPKSR